MAAELGYKNVYCFRGGLPEWIKAGYEVERKEKLPKVRVPTIGVAELEKLLGSDSAVLLDVRPAKESAKYRIEAANCVTIPFGEIDARLDRVPSGKKLILIDVNGKRTNIASRYLHLKGHTDLARLEGGINNWIKAGKKVVKLSAE